MSKTIDEKVVSMEFDNSKFEGNVKTTMSTLDKLKKSLNFKGATKGIESVEAASRKLDFSKLEIGATRAGFHVQDVWEKVTRYIENNIAQRIVNTGERIAKALTIDPVKTGFNEYELKMDSIRTILNSTGEPLERVNKLLNELNTYSDQTIYSFQDMTQNIGKFTNAGVKLDDAVLAIKGISNEAAVSGANANEASRAMYNFAQALSSGYVKLIDWKSIENANMATVEFKQQLIDSAVACGTLTKTADGMYATSKRNISVTQNFNDSLQDQWMTSEVLIETLKRYSDQNTDIGKKAFAAAQEVTKLSQMWDVLKETAQSGWAQTWELIFGDLNQAKAIFTPLTNFFSSIIDAMSDFRNGVLEAALGVSGPIKAIKEKLSGVKDIADKVSGATDTMTGAMKDFDEVVNQVIRGEWGRGQDRWDKLTEAGYNWAKVQNKVNEKLGSTVRHAEGATEAEGKLEKQTKRLTNAELKRIGMSDADIKAYREQERRSQSLSDAKLKELGLTESEIKLYRKLEEEYIKTGTSMDELYDKTSGRSLMIEGLKNLGESLVTVFKAVGTAWNNVMNGGRSQEETIASLAEKLRELIITFNIFSGNVLEKAKLRSNDIRRTFEGLFAAIQLITNIVGGGFKIAFKVITSILGMFNLDILDVTANIGDAIVALNNWVKAHDPLMKILEKLEPLIKDAVITISSGLKQAKKALTGWFKAIKDGKKTPREVAEEIIETFGYLTGFVGSGIKTILGYIGNGLKKVPEMLHILFTEGIEGLISYIKGSIGEVPKFFTSGIVGGILSGIGFVLEVIGELGSMMLAKIKEVLGIHSPSWEGFQIGLNFIKGIINGIVEAAKWLYGIVKDVFGKFLDIVKNIDFGAIIAAGISVGLISIVRTISKALDILSAPFEGIGKVLESASKFIDGFSKTVTKLGKATAFSIKMKAIKNLAIAIAIMVGSFVLLTMLDSSKFLPALGVMAAMVVMIGALAAVANKFGPKNIKQFSALSKAILSISGSLLIVAIALKMLSKANPEGLAAATTALIIVIGGLIGLIAIFEKMPKGFGPKKINSFTETIKSFTKMLTRLAIALLIMAIAVKILGKMKPSALAQGYLAILGFVAIIALLTLITKIGGKNISDQLSKTLISMSVAIGILAIVVKMLGKMKPSVLAQGYLAILGFVGIIALLTLITKIGGKEISNQLGKTLISMSVAIGILALSIKLLGSLSVDQIIKGYTAILGFVGIVALLTLLTKIISEKEMEKVGSTLLAMSLAIGILAAVSIVLSLISIPGLVKGIIAVGILSLFMAGLILATKNAQDCSKNLYAMAVAIGIMAACVAVLSIIKPAKLAGGVLALSIVMYFFTNMVEEVGKLKNTKGILSKLIIMIGIVAILAGLLVVLSDLPAKNSIAAATALGIMIGVFSISMNALSKFTKSKAIDRTVQNTLLIVLGIIAVLALVLTAMCWLIGDKIDNAIPAAIALGILMTALIGPMTALSKFTKTKVVDKSVMIMLGIMAGIVAILGIVIGALCHHCKNLDKSIIVAISLSLLLEALAGAMAILRAAGTIDKSVIAPLIIMSIVAGVLGGIIGAICSLSSNIDMAIQVSIAMSILVLALSAAMLILGQVKCINKSIISPLVVMTIAVGILGAVIGLICTYFKNLDNAINIAVSMSILLIAMSVAMGIVGAMSPLISMAISGIIGLSVAIALFVGLLYLLNEFMNNDTAKEFINGGGEMLCLLAETMGKAIGSFVGGVFESVSESLVTVGENLSEFMKKIQGFLTGCAGIKEDVATGAGYLADAIIAITVADLINNLTQFLSMGSSLADLGTELSKFMINALPFITISRTIDPDLMAGCESIANIIMTLTGAQILDGISRWLTGGSSFADFGEELKSFAPCVKNFAEQIKGIKYSDVEGGIEVAKAIVDLANNIPNEGGIWAGLFGDNGLAAFSNQMNNLGYGIKAFAFQAQGIKYEDVEGALKASKAIVELANDIPNEGGIWGGIFGENGLAAFSNQMSNLGLGIKSFWSQAKGVVYADVEGSLKAAKAIIDLANDIPNEGGLMARLFGENSLASFAPQMPDFGDGLKKYSEAVDGIKISAIEDSVTAASKIVELSKTIPEDKLFKNETTLDEFGKQLSKYGDGLSTYYNSISGVDMGSLNSSITATGRLITAVNNMIDMDTSGIDTFKKAIEALVDSKIGDFLDAYTGLDISLAVKGINDITTAVKGMDGINPSVIGPFKAAIAELSQINLDDFVNAFNGSAAEAAQSVSGLMSALTNAVYLGKNEFLTEFDAMITQVVTNISGKAPEFQSAGQNIMNMIKIGMGSTEQNGIAIGFTAMMDSLLGAISNKYISFMTAGQNLIRNFNYGIITGSNGGPTESLSSMLSNMITTVSEKLPLFTLAGQEVIKAFSNGMTGSANTSVMNAFGNIMSSAYTFISSRQSVFATAGQDLTNGLQNGIIAGSQDVITAMTTIAAKAYMSITNKKDLLKLAGQSLVAALNSGIEVKKEDTEEKISSLVFNSYDVLIRKYQTFYNAGGYLVDGFVAGIDANTWKAEAQAAAMAQAALEATKEALGIQSPSKEFYKLGDFSGQGFTNALKDYEITSGKAGESMGNSALKGLSDAIAKVKDLFGKDFDPNPTIRPVLDLSNVQNGMGSLSGMFSGMNGFSLNGSVAMAQQTNASMNSRRSSLAFENKISDEIVKLNESISGLRAEMAMQNEAAQTPPEVNLYMDSRKVASSLARPMDKELNMLAKRRQ